ncbi:Uncharacterised protein [Vibrio cholerae]|uniref:Uncharacterized protein n=1 Tax=Vibrio cholerae TaxID=666 RepID=A0A655TRE7_VIBCL|nr:Uncharacterised protein [Vibrio cholerae]CSB47227.1 Uncharacterised protein [Vibrio cholerae]CSC78244.1 Uncharacterised protein [Vibrio cholerae]
MHPRCTKYALRLLLSAHNEFWSERLARPDPLSHPDQPHPLPSRAVLFAVILVGYDQSPSPHLLTSFV